MPLFIFQSIDPGNNLGNIDEETDDDDNQPFLLRLVNQPQPSKSKQRLKSAVSSKPVKSKVRQSLDDAGYKRKWGRSSTAWSSYNNGELNTSSNLRYELRGESKRVLSSIQLRSRWNPFCIQPLIQSLTIMISYHLFHS